MTHDAFLLSLVEDMASVRWPVKREATLFVGDQPKSIGVASFSMTEPSAGQFQPTSETPLENFPLNGAVLKLTGRDERLKLHQLQRRSQPFQNVLKFSYNIIDA